MNNFKFIVLLAAILGSSSLFAQVFDVNFAPLNFSNGNQTLIIGSASTKNDAGAQVLYSNVITIGGLNGVGGQPIDCIVTNVGGSVTFDQNLSASSITRASGVDSMFAPQIATNFTNQFRYFKFRFVITTVINNANVYTDVVLENVVLNIYDLDREGQGNLRNRVLISKSNYSTYEEISSLIVAQNISGAELDVYQGQNATTNTEGSFADIADDNHRIRFVFSNLQTLNIGLGTENPTGNTNWNATSNYYLSFAPGSNFGATPVKNDIIVDLNATATGVNNQVTVESNNPYYFTLSGANIFKSSTTTLNGVNISYPISEIKDGANEKLIINGASVSIPLNFTTAPSQSTFTLSNNIYTVTYSIANGINTIRFTQLTNSVNSMDSTKVEALLDALQYQNTLPSGNGTGFRNFTVIGTGTFLLGTNPVPFNVISPPAIFIANIPTPLPVNVISFTGKALENANQLNWTVAQEVDFSHYEVLRSEDGRAFNMVGTVFATENNMDMKSYSFVDASVTSEVSYYKLRLVDNNGSVAYTSLVVVSRNAIVPTVSNLFPNPATTQVNIEVQGVSVDNFNVSVQDINGKIVYQANQVSALSNVYQMDVTNFNRGVYVIRIEDEMGNVSVSKFAVSK